MRINRIKETQSQLKRDPKFSLWEKLFLDECGIWKCDGGRIISSITNTRSQGPLIS